MSNLIKSISIDDFVRERNRVLEEIAFHIEQIKKISNENNIKISFPYIQKYIGSDFRTYDVYGRFDINKSETKKIVDAHSWDVILNETGLRSFMTPAQKKEWDKHISDCDVPDFTSENARNVFLEIHKNKNETFTQSVIDMSIFLNWDKENQQPFLFSQKTLKTRSAVISQFKINEHENIIEYPEDINELIRICCVLDKKQEPSSNDKLYRYSLTRDDRNSQKIWENYITIKNVYKNGSCHFNIHRQDLIEKINEIILSKYPNCIDKSQLKLSRL